MRLYSKETWHRLVRYLTGETSSAQKKNETEAWILEDETRAQLMDDLGRIWDASDVRLPSRDVDAAWEELGSELDASSNPETTGCRMKTEAENDTSSQSSVMTRNDRPVTRAQGSRPSMMTRVSRVGGVLLITVLLGILVLSEIPFDSTSSSDTKIFSTDAGQRATVRLNDGSKVRLNVESQLTLEPGFGESNRTVSLDGEAFFEVADDRSNPFVVRMGGARTEVIGTAFNIESYSEGRDHQVAVTEGSVMVHPDRSGRADTLQLRADNLGILADGHVQVLRESAEIQKEIAWKEGQLVFNDAPFEQVVRDLGRWYDAEVRAEVDVDQVEHLNATFKEESLREVAQAISVALDLRYREEGGKLTFYRTVNADTT